MCAADAPQQRSPSGDAADIESDPEAGREGTAREEPVPADGADEPAEHDGHHPYRPV